MSQTPQIIQPRGRPGRTRPPPVVGAVTDNDREFLYVMYQEHAQQARQHESLRAAITVGLFTLMAAILTASTANKQDQFFGIYGGMIIIISILGIFLNKKHYERNRLHTDVMFGIRASLGHGLTEHTCKNQDRGCTPPISEGDKSENCGHEAQNGGNTKVYAIRNINSDYRKWHKENYPFFNDEVSLNRVWEVIYYITIIVGLFLIYQKFACAR